MIPPSLRNLPHLPAMSAPTLPTSFHVGLNTGLSLVDPMRNPTPGIFEPMFIKVLDPDFNISREGNGCRRRVKAFTRANDSSRASLNNQLAGGEGSPILITALGIGAGLVSGGAGIMFSIMSTAIEMQRVNQPVRARSGDVVDMIEVLGQRDNKVYHWLTFVLADPFRTQAKQSPSEWVIHGAMSEVSFPG